MPTLDTLPSPAHQLSTPSHFKTLNINYENYWKLLKMFNCKTIEVRTSTVGTAHKARGKNGWGGA